VPPHVEQAFRTYLRCGILAHGFARAYCHGLATALFGWLGLLYASSRAGLLVLAAEVLNAVFFFVVFPENPAGFFGVKVLIHIVSLVWAYRASVAYNQRLLAGNQPL